MVRLSRRCPQAVDKCKSRLPATLPHAGRLVLGGAPACPRTDAGAFLAARATSLQCLAARLGAPGAGPDMGSRPLRPLGRPGPSTPPFWIGTPSAAADPFRRRGSAPLAARLATL